MSWLSENADLLQRFGAIWFAVGLVSLVLTLIALPLIVVRLPADYFVRHKRLPVGRSSRHPLLVWTASAVKNLFGILLVLFGIVMIFVPGQGTLTILIGLMLTNFPGKYRLEQKIVSREPVLRTLNRVRDRAGQPPLAAPEPE